MTRARTGLQRSQDDRIIAGVCGGVAEWLGWDPTLVRVLFVLVSIFSAAFPGILVYLILWIVMPERPDVLTDTVDYDYD
jgi:phage shock protein C